MNGNRLGAGTLDRLLGTKEGRVTLALPVPAEKHGGRPDEGERIGDIPTRDVGRGAVRSLPHRMLHPRVQRSAQAKAARQLGGQVRKNVAEHVGRYDDVEFLRRAHYVGHHRVHDVVVHFHFRVLLAHFVADVDEHAIGNLEHICLVHDGNTLRPGLRKRERGSGDALAAKPRNPT